MKLIERKFKRDGGGYGVWENKDSDYGLCEEMMDELFAIPVSVDEIWISLYDRATKDRYRVDVKDHGYPAMEVEAFGYWNDPGLDKVLKPLIGKTVYLQVEYEE